MLKNFKKICAITLGVLCVAATINAAEKVKLNKTYLSLEEGSSAKLKVIGSKKQVKWSSSNKKVATVSQKGKVNAKKAGNCKITAKVSSRKYICKVKVIKKTDGTVPTETSTPQTNPPQTSTPQTDAPQTNPPQTSAPQTSAPQTSAPQTNPPQTNTNNDKITGKELIIKENNKEIYGKIYYPKKEGKCPAVILSHGYNGAHSDFTRECTFFAENGYIAYAYDFCGGSTKSKSSGKSTDMTVFTEKEDLLTVFNYIQGLENVDSSQMFLMGASQGGFVTTLAAEELKDKTKCIVLYYPALNIPDDWRHNYPDISKIPEVRNFWGLQLGKEFFLSIHDFYTFDNIGSYPNDVLIIYGNKDNIVPYSAMLEAEKAYKSAELVVLENEGHGFSATTGKKTMEMALEFMNKHL